MNKSRLKRLEKALTLPTPIRDNRFVVALRRMYGEDVPDAQADDLSGSQPGDKFGAALLKIYGDPS